MTDQHVIEVCADWTAAKGPKTMGQLVATRSRAKEIFSFEYDPSWLKGAHRQPLDPGLLLFTGPQDPNAMR